MTDAQGVSHLGEGHTPDKLGTKMGEIAIQAEREIRSNNDIRASVVAAICLTTEYTAARGRHEVDHNIRCLLFARLRAGDVGQRDQPTEAVIKDRSPGRDCTMDCCQLFLAGARMRLDSNGQINMIPPIIVAAVEVIVHNNQRSCIRLR